MYESMSTAVNSVTCDTNLWVGLQPQLLRHNRTDSERQSPNKAPGWARQRQKYRRHCQERRDADVITNQKAQTSLRARRAWQSLDILVRPPFCTAVTCLRLPRPSGSQWRLFFLAVSSVRLNSVDV